MTEHSGEVEPGTESGRGGVWVFGQALLLALFLGSVIWGDPVQDVPGLTFARITGLVVAVAGAAVSVWSATYHGGNLTPFPKPPDEMPLINGGPYRFVRHPMYSGILLFTLGTGLAYANPVTMLSSFAFFVFFMAKTGAEEEWLVAEVPGYRTYRSEV
ncbi:MAG: methyltransferase family protein, partial [Acidimicrobiia bacterium]